mgnify:FL=1
MFITFEGIEGSGKSTHCRLTERFLIERGHQVLRLREPGGTEISEKVRGIILDKAHVHMTVECELLLYNAARVQLVSEIILPALEKGTVVLCDRFYDSTVAYQCYGGELDQDIAVYINGFAARGIVPDLTFLLDSDAERGLNRSCRGDRMELKSLEFHQRVRRGFLTLAEHDPERVRVVEEMSIEEGTKIIQDILCQQGL